MGATREFTFIVGPETSTQPTATAPTVDADFMTLGYANGHYTQGKQSVADLTALKAVTNSGANARVNGDVILLRSTGLLYRFDSASGATGDDDIIVTPTTGTGRWFKAGINSQSAVHLTDTTQSTSKDTGALILEGGIGVEKNAYIGGDCEITGNLTVQGTQTILNTATLEVEDANIVVNNGGNDASSEGAGLSVERTTTNANILHENALASKFKIGAAGSEAQVATVSHAQTFTNKRFEGGTSSDTDSVRVSQKSGVAGVTASTGVLTYDTATSQLKVGNGATFDTLAAAADWGTATTGSLNTSKQSGSGLKGFLGGAYVVKNVRASEGAGTTTLLDADSRHQIFNLSASRTCQLPTTDIKKGEEFIIETIPAAITVILTVNASAGATITTVRAGHLRLIALIDSPTTPANWLLAEAQERGGYIPSYVDGANVAGHTATAFDTTYIRDGKYVTVYGVVEIDPTAAAVLTRLRISIPIASALTDALELNGMATRENVSAPSSLPAYVEANATNDDAEIFYINDADLANRRWVYHFRYVIN